MVRTTARRWRRFASALSIPILVGCTHHAGVLKRYDEALPIAGTEVVAEAARPTLEITVDVAGIAADGVLRGTATAAVDGSMEFEVCAHEVGARQDYEFYEATLWRAFAAPIRTVLLLPFFGDGMPDYGGDGAVGIGDRLLGFVHEWNPLIAWPHGSRRAGEDRVVSTHRERRDTTIPLVPDLELVLTSRRGTATVPAPVDDEGAFAVDVLTVLGRVWDHDVRGELRDRRGDRARALPRFGEHALAHLTAVGRLEEFDWQAACAADTRVAYRAFASRHRDSAYAAEVDVMLREIEWREAVAAGDRQALAAFLRRQPQSPHAEEARVRIEEFDWQRAAAADTDAAYRQFLAAHAEGARAEAAERRIEALRAAAGWQRAQRLDTAAALRAFVAEHPEAEQVAAARTRLAALAGHEDAWLAVCRAGTDEAFRAFLTADPDGPYAGAAERALRDLEGRPVTELLDEGKVEVRTAGDSIRAVRAEVRRLVPYPVRVQVPVGSYFVAARQAAQNMVVTAGKTVHLTDDEWQQVVLPAACANQPRAIPGPKDTFTIRPPEHAVELARLAAVLDRADVDYATRQAAVWVVTDDASYASLGHLVSRHAGMITGGTRIIREPQAARALQLCDEAGIPIEGRRLLADREALLRALPDGDLKSWLADQEPAPGKR